jgi:hypothetical protein
MWQKSLYMVYRMGSWDHRIMGSGDQGIMDHGSMGSWDQGITEF